MSYAIVQAAASLVLASSLAVYLLLRPLRTPLRSPLLGLLASLILWAAGVIWRFAAPDDATAWQGFRFAWLGIAAVPPLWLVLAARYARGETLERRPLVVAALFVPAVFAWLALATNDTHRLFVRSFSQTALERGPLFYSWLAFAYPTIAAGVVLFVLAARRTFERNERSRMWIAITGALLPAGASLLFVSKLLPLRYDPTPGALAISILLFTFGIFRLHFLDALPLARRDVIDHLHDGVLITDGAGLVLDANLRALEILGRPVEGVRGHALSLLLREIGREPEPSSALASAALALGPDEVLPRRELSARLDRILEVTGKCLRGPDRSALARVLVLRDRTEERRYERLLRQTQKLETVGSLAAGVAHEVNNPLAFVRANLHQLERLGGQLAKHVDTLARTDPEAQELAELPQIVAECLDGIDRIGRIVGAMRRFSRLPAEELGPVDVNEAVHEAIRLAELHHNRGVTIEAWLAEGLPAVHGSAQRLTQVVLNLLVNAKQALAGHTDRHITVYTRLTRDIIELAVLDDGPGVPEALRERIFDPFFTTKGPEEGTGLGLAIAFDIVREHGGVLELRPGPRGGACFLARLPAYGDADALAASAAAG
ncbi:MAG: ATP-binding protein [Deltaproteobacteria bacterium]|nr:ATP-binding protein [Deltaproteobacteria bacterium]